MYIPWANHTVVARTFLHIFFRVFYNWNLNIYLQQFFIIFEKCPPFSGWNQLKAKFQLLTVAIAKMSLDLPFPWDHKKSEDDKIAWNCKPTWSYWRKENKCAVHGNNKNHSMHNVLAQVELLLTYWDWDLDMGKYCEAQECTEKPKPWKLLV